MSLILESLEQAERDRKARRKTKAGSAGEPAGTSPAPASGRQPRWFLIVAAVAAVLAVAVYFGIDRDRPQVASSPSPAVTKKVEGRMPPESRASAEVPASPSGVSTAEAEPASPVSAGEHPSSPAASDPAAGQASEGEQADPDVRETARRADAAIQPAPRTASTVETPASKEEFAPATSESGATPPLSQADRRPPERVPLLRELPPDVQARFKDLNLNVVAFETDPAKSVVFINLRQYRAGDRIAGNGPRVERILPEAVDLDYGQGWFRLQMYP